MDFFKQAQQAVDSAQEAIQSAASQLSETTSQVNQTVTEAVEQGKTTFDEMIVLGSETTEQARALSAEAIQQGSDTITRTYNQLTTQSIAIGTSGMTIANALKDLPQTAADLAREMPRIAHRLKYRAGTRTTDLSRADADIMELFNKIPGTSKLGDSQRNISDFLSNKEGSHIRSHYHGGSNKADNIVWEIGADNFRRGAQNMTGGEQVYIRFHNAFESLLQNSGTIAQLGLATTGTAVITQALVTAASYALDLYRGDITAEEFTDRIVAAAVSAGITTPIFFLILIAVLALFPEFIVILSAPAVVAGFNLLFGIGIATPIIQSIIRHIEADGFGEEIAQDYENWVNEINRLIEVSTQEMQRVAEGFMLEST
jgi:polyhydroxyalkanoate synthesis regulator phasin